jgi:hypothetical protein
MALNNAPDLTKRPPRGPRVRIGGYVLLARIIDKGRAVLAKTNGEYNYDCPSDQRFFQFAGVNPKAMLAQLKSGRGDGEILNWVRKNTKNKRTDSEIAAWSQYSELRVPSDVESREFFHGVHQKIAPQRDDIGTWFDLLDLDDYVSFGGKP